MKELAKNLKFHKNPDIGLCVYVKAWKLSGWREKIIHFNLRSKRLDRTCDIDSALTAKLLITISTRSQWRSVPFKREIDKLKFAFCPYTKFCKCYEEIKKSKYVKYFEQPFKQFNVALQSRYIKIYLRKSLQIFVWPEKSFTLSYGA